VVLGGGEGVERGPRALVLNMESAEGDTNVAHLAPVFAPGVADDPVLTSLRVLAPTNDGDDVVDELTTVGGDARGVVQDGSSVDAASDRTAGEDLTEV